MYKKYFLGLLIWFFSIMSLAALPPEAMLQQVSIQLLTEITQNKSAIKSNPNVLYHIVQKSLIPHIDLNVMSRAVVGNHYWQPATSSQQEEFKLQFSRFVTRTYSSAFENYNGEKVLFYPVRGGSANQTQVQVHSKILRSNRADIAMTYRLYRDGESWKVSDISVEGVSMVQSYRSQFAGVLAQKGFTGLIQDLKTRNRND